MQFHGFEVIPTSEAVYSALLAEHREELSVFSARTNMDEGLIETLWGLKGADYPLFGARSTWGTEGISDAVSERKNEHYLCVYLREAGG